MEIVEESVRPDDANNRVIEDPHTLLMLAANLVLMADEQLNEPCSKCDELLLELRENAEILMARMHKAHLKLV